MWKFDRSVVDGFVNGSSWVTLFGSWMSGLTDRKVVDGLVNQIGSRLPARTGRSTTRSPKLRLTGGALHLGFNTASNVWESVAVPATGGWQSAYHPL